MPATSRCGRGPSSRCVARVRGAFEGWERSLAFEGLDGIGRDRVNWLERALRSPTDLISSTRNMLILDEFEQTTI